MPGRKTGHRRALLSWGAASLWAVICAVPANGQYMGRPSPLPPSTVVTQVRIDQQLNGRVPLDLRFRNEAGETVPLSACLDGKPAVLTLVYFGCPSLCTVTLNNLTGALGAVSLDAGDEFSILTVSFDPDEAPKLAAAKKAAYLRQYDRPTAARGWHFLTGDEESIASLTDAVGFRYVYDPATGEYAHASVVIVLTPEGRISRYLFGLEHSPKDLQLALVEASERRVGSVVDRALLLCYQYDPVSGRYGFAIMSALKAGGALTMLMIGAYVGRKLWQERRATAGSGASSSSSSGAPPG